MVYATGSAILRPGLHVERLSTIDWRSTDPVSLSGNNLANLIEGNAGNNLLNSGSTGASDTMVGFGGDDTYEVWNTGDVIVEMEGQGTELVRAHVNYELGANVENAEVTTEGLRLTGNDLANVLTGSGGAEVLDGRGGADTLIGRGGDDIYVVDTPSDIIVESGGNDTVYTYSDYTLPNAEAPFQPNTGTGIETLSSVDWSLVLNLRLIGNHLANTIHGDAGANFIHGGRSFDTMSGHGGADTFAFTTGLPEHNWILDFVPGTDKIVLDDAIINGLSLGAVPSAAFVKGTHATSPSHRIIYNPATGNLFFDQDGSGGANQLIFATVGTNLDIQSSDIIVI